MKTDSKEASAESFGESSSERRAHTVKNRNFMQFNFRCLDPLRSEESLKAPSDVEQGSEREHIPAGNCPQQRRPLLPGRTERVCRANCTLKNKKGKRKLLCREKGKKGNKKGNLPNREEGWKGNKMKFLGGKRRNV